MSLTKKEQLLFIIILNWNQRELTLKCISALKRAVLKTKIITIIVVDNHSSDRSSVVIKKLHPWITIIENKKNLGWAGGNNLGVKYALQNKSNCVLLLNNDVVIEKNCIQHLIKKLYSKPSIGIVGPKLYFDNTSRLIQDAGGVLVKPRFFGNNRGINEKDKGQFNKEEEMDFISGACMMIKKEVFERVGLLDNNYFLYYEDVDFCLRAKKAGYSSVYVPKSIAFHKLAATSKLGSPLHTYYNERNHLLLVEKHAPLLLKIREFVRIPKTIWEKNKNSDPIYKKFALLGIRDYLLRRFGEQSYW